MYGNIDRRIYESSVLNAKSFRQEIVSSFNKQIKQAIPGIKKGGGRFWIIPLNNKVYFYVTFEFPKYLEGDSTLSIFYGMENLYIKATENMSVRKEKYIKFPYGIHHKLFEFDNVAWNKEKVGYMYWKLLMQQKKIHYYTKHQTEYAIEILLPYTVNQIKKSYTYLDAKFKGTDREFPDIRIR